ncbi:MAG: hypothetical protein ACW9W3_06400 [Candidatus Nitrosopumilus sp. bin_68KS]
MKTRLLILLAIGAIGFSVNVFADCAPATLQHHYDSSDAVFHGTLISAQYDVGKSSPTSWTFAIQESFKGIDSKKVIVNNADKYGEQFKQGLDYLVFAEYNQQQLELHLCNFQYYAFPTIVEMVSQLDEPSNPYGDILQNQLDQHLTEIEKIKLEKRSENFAKERQKERDRLFGQAMLIGIPSAIGIGVAVMWVKTMRVK